MTYVFHPAAEAEFLESVGYYESQVPGLGGAFKEEFEALTELIGDSPKGWQVELVYCPVLIADISESPSGQLQGACSPEGWFPFKSAQRRRWPLGGSPEGSPANGPQRRCKP